MFNRTFYAVVMAMFLVTCTTYDSAVLYHKDFTPGRSELLRFNGYYTPADEFERTGKVRPMFFYADGSMVQLEIPVPKDQVGKYMAQNDRNWAWGNYKVAGDTIKTERFNFVNSNNNYRRVLQNGILSENTISWNFRQYGRLESDSISYKSVFVPFESKPDSTKNWTRTFERYNK